MLPQYTVTVSRNYSKVVNMSLALAVTREVTQLKQLSIVRKFPKDGPFVLYSLKSLPTISTIIGSAWKKSRSTKLMGHQTEYTEYLSLTLKTAQRAAPTPRKILKWFSRWWVWLFLGFEKLLLKDIQRKACRSALWYTPVYWPDIPQLLENHPLWFDARREKVRLTGVWLEQRWEHFAR